MKLKPLHTLFSISLFFSFSLFYNNAFAQADMYANQLINNSSDFQYPNRAVDTNETNYAYVSNVLGVLNTSYLKVSFPQSGKAGDVVNITVSSTGQTLGLNLLSNVTIYLYDSLGNQVASASGNNLLQLSLLVGGSNTYAIRYFTDPSDTFKFKSVRLELNNVLSANVLNEFRVYNFFIQQPCPSVYADGVHASGTGGLLAGYVSNPSYAADTNPNNSATMAVPLNLLSLLPPAYLDLSFSQMGRGGDYVGFTISQASSLLNLSLLQNLEIKIYDENGTLEQTKSGFSLLDLQLLSGTSDRYTLGFVSDSGNYKIARLRLTLSATIGLLQNLKVYNAFHYSINRPSVEVTASGPTTFCQGGSVTLTANDSLGASDYIWSNGQATQSITVTQSGTYTVQVMDSLSCSRESIPIQVTVLPNPHPTITGDTVLCAGASGNLHTLHHYAGYTWSTGSTDSAINISDAGNYYVTVTDSNSCTGADTAMVRNNSLLITPTITKVSCSNSANGAVSLSVSGGSGNYIYKWSNGNTTHAISNLPVGIYTSIIKDSVYGCSYNRAYTVTANKTLAIKSSVVNTSSCGKSDGKATVSVVGGSGSYTYNWSNGGTTATINNVPAGIYRVTATDGTSGCQVSDTVTVSDGSSNLQITPTINGNASCNTANGSISIMTSGGSGNYSYSWSNGSTSASLSGLHAGKYYLLVKDNTAQCSKGFAIIVPDNSAIVISGTVNASSCNNKTGSIAASATGGSGNYTYAWSNGATTANINNVQSGTYILSVNDNTSGCSNSKVFTIGETGAPTATLSTTQPSCASNGNGAINVTASGNNVYYWSNGSASQNQSSLAPGTYIVTVTDTASGCSATYSATLTPKTQISITASPSSNTACPSSANGSVAVQVIGGTSPYTYSWSNGATTDSLHNVNAGTYSLNVQDAGGCTATISVPVTTDSSKLLSIALDSIIKASCNTATNGSIMVTTSGGSAPYTYNWSNGATTQNLMNVEPGSYTVTVTDAVGCSKQLIASIGVDTSNAIMIAIDSTHSAGCAGSTSGAIYISVSGGATPYGYSWSNGATTQNLLNVLAGTYTVHVTDNNGCTAQKSANVPVSNTGLLAITVYSTKKASCNVSADGNVYVHVTGGLPPYTYSWSNGDTTANLTNANPGTYTLTVTDANGCPGQKTVTLNIDSTNMLMVSVDSTIGAGCATGNSAEIYITVSGGATPYTYHWSNGAMTSDLMNVVPGSYTLTVTDAKGCNIAYTAQAVVDSSKSILATVDSVAGAGCIGSNSGSIYVSVSRGVPPYSYQWSNSATTQDLTNVPTGSYTLTINDASGCDANISASVNVDTSKAINVTVDSVQGPGCSLSANGNIYTHVTGGRTPYAYSWSNGATSQNLMGVVAGGYTLTVTDANGCTGEASINLMVDTSRAIHIIASSIQPAECNVSATGSITVLVNGGVPPYVYNWSNGDNMQNLANVMPGSYTLTVTDAAGCSNQLSANVGIDTANQLTATVSSVTDARCLNSLSGSVDVNVAGGTLPYMYSWSNGTTSQDLSYVASGSYMLNVMDAAGCSTQLNVNVGIDTSNPVMLSLDSVVNVGCGDSSSGQIYVTASGGIAPYTYLWSNGSITEDLINVPVGSYNLTATDDAGCNATLSANVMNAAPFVISADVQNVKCYGQSNGSIALTVTNGSGVYAYTWSNGATASTVNGLNAQVYTVTVKDQLNGCSQTDSFNVTENDSLSVSASIINDSCNLTNGAVNLKVNGGTPPYTYTWSNNTTLQDLLNVLAGTYTVTVTDQNMCSKQLSVNVAEADCHDNIIIHNVITPNGDGVNDQWVIEGIGAYPKNEVQVFDKWGDVVYQSSNYQNNWTGLRSNGDQLPGGTYYYLVKLNEPNRHGGKNAFTGYILIQR